MREKVSKRIVFTQTHIRVSPQEAIVFIFIDHVALAKQGDNALSSVCPSVCQAELLDL